MTKHLVVREQRRTVGTAGAGDRKQSVVIINGVVGRGQNMDAEGRNYSFTLFDYERDGIKVRLYDDDNRRNVREDHLQRHRAAVIADYRNVKAGKVARAVIDLELRWYHGAIDADSYRRECEHMRYVVVTSHGIPAKAGEQLADKVHRFEAARRAAWEAGKADLRKQAGPDLQPGKLREVTNGAGQVALFDSAGRFHGLAVKAGPIARLVAEEIACELSGQFADNPPYYESAVVQAFAGRFPSESAYGKALQNASAAHDADCAVYWNRPEVNLIFSKWAHIRATAPASGKAGPYVRKYLERAKRRPEWLGHKTRFFTSGASAIGHDADCAVPLPDRPRGLFSVAVYHVERVFGGHEEGGWYYTAGDLAPEFGVHLRMFEREGAAYAYARTLTDTVIAEANQGRRPLSSVLSDGAYQARVTSGFAPSHFPETRPYYE